MFNKVKLSSICLLFAALLFVGCKSDDNITPDKPEEQEEWPDSRDVYVAGFENVQNEPVARLWKNGELQNLAGSSGSDLRSTGIIRSEARSVFVSGDDVYVAGYDVIVNGDNWIVSGNDVMTNGDEISVRARLWKNGELQHLSCGTYASKAFAVFVSGNDVYVAGHEALTPDPNPSKFALIVWKNGEPEIFAEGDRECQVNSIFVSDGDVYIAGSIRKPFGLQATFWKNGVEETLVSESTESCAHCVFVAGDDVYVAGYDSYMLNHSYNAIAKLWKNGKVEKLTDGTKKAGAYSVHISDDGDIYVAGHDGFNAKLWKNGTIQNIVDDEDAVMYHSVFVKDNDVYIAGYVKVIEPLSDGLAHGYWKATLWKNGKRLNLNTGKSNSYAFSVFVK